MCEKHGQSVSSVTAVARQTQLKDMMRAIEAIEGLEAPSLIVRVVLDYVSSSESPIGTMTPSFRLISIQMLVVAGR